MNLSETLQQETKERCDKPPTIEELVNQASEPICPVWPLKNGIACNPLLGWEHKEFWQAIEEAELLFSHVNGSIKISDTKVNNHLIKWLQVFLDRGQATWSMPNRSLGFYRCWLKLAPYDRHLIRTQEDRKTLFSFTQDPATAIELVMKRVGIENKLQYLQEQLAQLPGWAGYIKWGTQWANEPSKYPIDLIQLIAVRLIILSIIEQQMDAQIQIEKKNESIPPRWTREEIETQENRYRDEWVAKLCSEAKKRPLPKPDPLGQLIFCIDVRSESFRKQLEAQGRWETFGFAGFFGIPISLKRNGEDPKLDACPVLLKPKHTVVEMTDRSIVSKWIIKNRALLLEIYRRLKYQLGTPFALAEAIGPWSGIWMAFKSLVPRTASILNQFHNKKHKHDFCWLEKSISFQEQVDYAASALSMIGLQKDFAPLVVFCGHGARVQNNPHASTLDCGACGGNPGGANARLIAQILNTPSIRSELQKRGIEIPLSTLFLGAEHETTSDEVTLFHDRKHIETHGHLIKNLKADLKRIQKVNASIRMTHLSSTPNVKEAIRRSVDWAETRPEWGLAKNGGFLVAPRRLSENLDLQSRFFLHSYDWTRDDAGTALETILTAPMVVAEWINMQYFFSTFNPIAFGSGSKVTQNVVGKIGVMQGNGSDLMHGLPLQSIYSNDAEPYHIPMRLLVIVFAPRKRIETIVKKHPILQKLFYNNWVKMVAIDPDEIKPYQLESTGLWSEMSKNQDI